MGIGYIVLPPVLALRFIFVSRSVSLYTVIERVKSRFRKDRTKRDEHLLKMLQTASNHESSGYPTLL